LVYDEGETDQNLPPMSLNATRVNVTTRNAWPGSLATASDMLEKALEILRTFD
jgi:hypothetical protein